MRRMQLLTMMLAMIAIGSAFATEPGVEEAEGPRDLGLTVSCGVSGGLPTLSRGACTLSKRVVTLANLEIEVILDGQLSLVNTRPGYAGAFIAVTYYGPRWTVFAEVATPSVMPPIGSGDLWRAGFSARF